MDRGIYSTIYANPTKPKAEAELLAVAKRYYAGKPFVRVKAALPATKDTAHSNYLDVTYRVVRGKVLVLAAEDNLVRGASGVAVQNFNLMFGYDDVTGLN
jgi:N-acetyl-gamma-glutamyl-phosphate reductase